MRRHKNLFEKIISFQNLLKAARLAQRGKRFKTDTARFNFHLERELWQLQAELAEKRYEPGGYYHFTIHEPKERLISAAPYRDRVVHHAIHNILEPIFDPTFIYDSYATRKGKGTHAAIDRFQKFAQIKPYVLKCDIRKYFPSIDCEILLTLIERKVACAETLWLIKTVLESSWKYGRGGTSFVASQPASQKTGIPIGNLTSQFFANVYLNGMDHYIQERLGCRYYLRYMDDFVVFHEDKRFLLSVKEAIKEYLKGLRLLLHEEKCRVYKSSDGVPFLGMVIFPYRRRLKRDNVVRFKRRLKRFQELHKTGQIPWRRIHQSIQSWIGHAFHADSWRLRELIFSEIVFRAP